MSAPGAPGRGKVFALTWWRQARGGRRSAEVSAGGSGPGEQSFLQAEGKDREPARRVRAGVGSRQEWNFVAWTATDPLWFS